MGGGDGVRPSFCFILKQTAYVSHKYLKQNTVIDKGVFMEKMLTKNREQTARQVDGNKLNLTVIIKT